MDLWLILVHSFSRRCLENSHVKTVLNCPLLFSVSDEENLSKHHTISPDGYNTGRDKLVKTATTGVTSNWGKKYTATKQVISGLLPPGIEGVNHGKPSDCPDAVAVPHPT